MGRRRLLWLLLSGCLVAELRVRCRHETWRCSLRVRTKSRSERRRQRQDHHRSQSGALFSRARVRSKLGRPWVCVTKGWDRPKGGGGGGGAETAQHTNSACLSWSGEACQGRQSSAPSFRTKPVPTVTWTDLCLFAEAVPKAKRSEKPTSSRLATNKVPERARRGHNRARLAQRLGGRTAEWWVGGVVVVVRVVEGAQAVAVVEWPGSRSVRPPTVRPRPLVTPPGFHGVSLVPTSLMTVN